MMRSLTRATASISLSLRRTAVQPITRTRLPAVLQVAKVAGALTLGAAAWEVTSIFQDATNKKQDSEAITTCCQNAQANHPDMVVIGIHGSSGGLRVPVCLEDRRDLHFFPVGDRTQPDAVSGARAYSVPSAYRMIVKKCFGQDTVTGTVYVLAMPRNLLSALRTEQSQVQYLDFSHPGGSEVGTETRFIRPDGGQVLMVIRPFGVPVITPAGQAALSIVDGIPMTSPQSLTHRIASQIRRWVPEADCNVTLLKRYAAPA